MILDRRLYKSLNFIQKSIRFSRYVFHNSVRMFFNVERKKAIDYPIEKLSYSPRYRHGIKSFRCPKCDKPGVKVELIYQGNTLKKSFIGECLSCFYYWPIEKD